MSLKESLQKELKGLGIGSKVRTLREGRDFSVNELAEKIKITPVLLSQIEQEVVPPTIATLLNIARLLDVNIDYFFVRKDSVEGVELTRPHERLLLSKSRPSDSPRLTYKYQALSYRLQGKKMEPFLIEFDTDTKENLVPLSHEGEEFIYCLEGEIEYISDDKKITLRPGDSLYYFSTVPHVLRGKGITTPKAIAVLLP